MLTTALFSTSQSVDQHLYQLFAIKNGHIHIRLVSVYDAIFYCARIRYTVVDPVTVLESGPSQNFGREGPQWLECS